MAQYKKNNQDNDAFNKMQDLNKGAPDTMFKEGKLFTESEYNLNASPREKRDYDMMAYKTLQDIFAADKARNPRIKDWSFNRYLENLNSSYLEEIIQSEEHPIPTKGSREIYQNLLNDIYGGDVDQLKLSAWNVEKRDSNIDRANIPAGEKY